MSGIGIVKLQEMQDHAFASGNASELARIQRIAELRGLKLKSRVET